MFNNLLTGYLHSAVVKSQIQEGRLGGDEDFGRAGSAAADKCS